MTALAAASRAIDGACRSIESACRRLPRLRGLLRRSPPAVQAACRVNAFAACNPVGRLHLLGSRGLMGFSTASDQVDCSVAASEQAACSVTAYTGWAPAGVPKRVVLRCAPAGVPKRVVLRCAPAGVPKRVVLGPRGCGRDVLPLGAAARSAVVGASALPLLLPDFAGGSGEGWPVGGRGCSGEEDALPLHASRGWAHLAYLALVADPTGLVLEVPDWPMIGVERG